MGVTFCLGTARAVKYKIPSLSAATADIDATWYSSFVGVDLKRSLTTSNCPRKSLDHLRVLIVLRRTILRRPYRFCWDHLPESQACLRFVR